MLECGVSPERALGGGRGTEPPSSLVLRRISKLNSSFYLETPVWPQTISRDPKITSSPRTNLGTLTIASRDLLRIVPGTLRKLQGLQDITRALENTLVSPSYASSFSFPHRLQA